MNRRALSALLMVTLSAGASLTAGLAATAEADRAIKDGRYRIASRQNPEMCLDLRTAAEVAEKPTDVTKLDKSQAQAALMRRRAAAPDAVVFHLCSNAESQIWAIERDGASPDGLLIRNASGRDVYLGTARERTFDLNEVRFGPRSEDRNQHWRPGLSNTADEFQLVNSATGECLDSSGSVTSGSSPEQYPCRPSHYASFWILMPAGSSATAATVPR